MAQLLQNALCGTALILAAALLRRVLKGRLLPGARLCLWAVCLFRLLTPAFPQSALSLWGLLAKPAQAPGRAPPSYAAAPLPSAPVPRPPQAPQLYVPAVTPPVPGGGPPVPAPRPDPSIPWETVLLAVWLAVGLALAVRYVLRWDRTRRAVGYAIPLGRDDPRYLPLPPFARLREGPMEGAPLTFGAARPTVVLPPGLSGEALDCVLAHEGVHARRRDNLWHYAMALALVVHWWDPAVWLMARLLRRDIELSCDRAAVKRLGMARQGDYARALVSLSTRGEGPAFSHAFGQKLTEERIIAIMKYKKTTALGLALSIFLVCGVTVAFATDPVEKAGEPHDSVSEAVDSAIESLPVAVELVLPKDLKAFAEESFARVYGSMAAGSTAEPAVQSDCTHPNSTYVGQSFVYLKSTPSAHIAGVSDCYRCNVCDQDFSVVKNVKSEGHTWGTTSNYEGSDHSAANSAKHFATYTHRCIYCGGIYPFTSFLGCTQGGCVDVLSVTPEPSVADPAPDVSAAVELGGKAE